MGTLILEDFKIGLDRRRMNETSLPGSLTTCQNAHITRGGEVERGEAFVRFYDLPDNTFGLKAVPDGFLVFGSDNITPTVLNSNPNVRYQRLNDSGGTQSWGDFTLDGNQVAGDTFTSILVASQEILPATSTCPSLVTNWASQLATEITSNSGVSGFAATSVGEKVIVYAVAVGTTNNGEAWTHVKTGTVAVSANTNFSGGLAATNPEMTEVLSVELYDAIPYVIASYSDGIVRHWYNGIQVDDMKSGKGKTSFSIAAIAADAGAVASTGSFIIVDPVDACSISSITVDATELLAGAITFDDDATSTTYDEDGFFVKVADAINQYSATSGYTATLQAGRKIVITAEIKGSGPNGDAVAVVTGGSITIQSETAMAGGVAAKQITSVTINAVEIMPNDVDWAESNQQTATAVAATINDNTATSGYEAVAFGSTVLINLTTDGTAVNGHALAVVKDAEITITAAASVQGGSGIPTVVEPGRFCKTYKNKMYVLTGPSMYYSSIGEPPRFRDGTGEGFDNLSTNTSGSEVLLAMANYFDNAAIFARNNVSIWFLSDDPNDNSQVQVLSNTGTVAPDSVTEFGDNDVFYLSESGIRSLRARDTTNAAFVNDVGIAIDLLLQQELLTNNVAAEKAIGILEPRQGRFMLAIDNQFYVFSFFPSSKISAWSTYLPGFSITGIDAIGQTVVCRSTNALYKIGSTTQRVYDAREIKVITPFLYGNDPSVAKQFSGIDMACEGTWEVWAAYDPLRVNSDGDPDEEFFERIGTVTGTTYAETGGENGNMGFEGISTHIALMFKCKSPIRARIGNVAIHFTDGGAKQ